MQLKLTLHSIDRFSALYYSSAALCSAYIIIRCDEFSVELIFLFVIIIIIIILFVSRIQ